MLDRLQADGEILALGKFPSCRHLGDGLRDFKNALEHCLEELNGNTTVWDRLNHYRKCFMEFYEAVTGVTDTPVLEASETWRRQAHGGSDDGPLPHCNVPQYTIIKKWLILRGCEQHYRAVEWSELMPVHQERNLMLAGLRPEMTWEDILMLDFKEVTKIVDDYLFPHA